MGALSFIRNRAKAGFPLLRRGAEAILARGGVTPAVTQPGPGGTTILVSPEVVQPKGILRSRSVGFSAIAFLYAIGHAVGWNLWLSEEQAQQLFNVLEPALVALAGWFRVVAHMPTRGPTM